jgi:hypothetical protein
VDDDVALPGAGEHEIGRTVGVEITGRHVEGRGIEAEREACAPIGGPWPLPQPRVLTDGDDVRCAVAAQIVDDARVLVARLDRETDASWRIGTRSVTAARGPETEQTAGESNASRDAVYTRAAMKQPSG